MPKQMRKHRVGTDEEPTSLRLPRTSGIKHFGLIGGTPFLWVEEHDGERTLRRNYRTFKTGQDIPDGWEYIQSAQDPQTDTSIHLYKESNDF